MWKHIRFAALRYLVPERMVPILIIEFSAPITLMTISRLRCELEELLGLGVDIIHGPIQPTDMIEIGKVVELYAA